MNIQPKFEYEKIYQTMLEKFSTPLVHDHMNEKPHDISNLESFITCTTACFENMHNYTF